MRTTAAFLGLGLAKLGITGCKRDDRARCQGAILGLMRLNLLFLVKFVATKKQRLNLPSSGRLTGCARWPPLMSDVRRPKEHL